MVAIRRDAQARGQPAAGTAPRGRPPAAPLDVARHALRTRRKPTARTHRVLGICLVSIVFEGYDLVAYGTAHWLEYLDIAGAVFTERLLPSTEW